MMQFIQNLYSQKQFLIFYFLVCSTVIAFSYILYLGGVSENLHGLYIIRIMAQENFYTTDISVQNQSKPTNGKIFYIYATNYCTQNYKSFYEAFPSFPKVSPIYNCFDFKARYIPDLEQQFPLNSKCSYNPFVAFKTTQINLVNVMLGAVVVNSLGLIWLVLAGVLRSSVFGFIHISNSVVAFVLSVLIVAWSAQIASKIDDNIFACYEKSDINIVGRSKGFTALAYVIMVIQIIEKLAIIMALLKLWISPPHRKKSSGTRTTGSTGNGNATSGGVDYGGSSYGASDSHNGHGSGCGNNNSGGGHASHYNGCSNNDSGGGYSGGYSGGGDSGGGGGDGGGGGGGD
jgi:hypothetical protein